MLHLFTLTVILIDIIYFAIKADTGVQADHRSIITDSRTLQRQKGFLKENLNVEVIVCTQNVCLVELIK